MHLKFNVFNALWAAILFLLPPFDCGFEIMNVYGGRLSVEIIFVSGALEIVFYLIFLTLFILMEITAGDFCHNILDNRNHFISSP